MFIILRWLYVSLSYSQIKRKAFTLISKSSVILLNIDFDVLSVNDSGGERVPQL